MLQAKHCESNSVVQRKGRQRRAVKDSMTSSKDVNRIIQRPPTTSLQLLCHEY